MYSFYYRVFLIGCCLPVLCTLYIVCKFQNKKLCDISLLETYSLLQTVEIPHNDIEGGNTIMIFCFVFFVADSTSFVSLKQVFILLLLPDYHSLSMNGSLSTCDHVINKHLKEIHSSHAAWKYFEERIYKISHNLSLCWACILYKTFTINRCILHISSILCL